MPTRFANKGPLKDVRVGAFLVVIIGVVGAISWLVATRKCWSRPKLANGTCELPFIEPNPLSLTIPKNPATYKSLGLVLPVNPGVYHLEVTGPCYSAQCDLVISSAVPPDDEWSHIEKKCRGDELAFSGVFRRDIMVPAMRHASLRIRRGDQVIVAREYVEDSRFCMTPVEASRHR